MEMDNDRLSILKSLADNDNNTAAIKELIAYYREIGDSKNAEYYETKLSKIEKERRADAKKHRGSQKNIRRFFGSRGISALAIIVILLIVVGVISINDSNKDNISDNTDDTDTTVQDSAWSKNASTYTSDVEITEDADVIAYKNNVYFTDYAQDAQYFDYEHVCILFKEAELVLYVDSQFTSFCGSFAYKIENSDRVESITAAIYCDYILVYSTKITADSEPGDVSFDIDVTGVDYIEVTVDDIEGTNYGGSIIFYDAVLCID